MIATIYKQVLKNLVTVNNQKREWTTVLLRNILLKTFLAIQVHLLIIAFKWMILETLCWIINQIVINHIFDTFGLTYLVSVDVNFRHQGGNMFYINTRIVKLQKHKYGLYKIFQIKILRIVLLPSWFMNWLQSRIL